MNTNHSDVSLSVELFLGEAAWDGSAAKGGGACDSGFGLEP